MSVRCAELLYGGEYGNAKGWLLSGNGELRAVPCSFPLGAESSSQFPPAFPDEKRRVIDLFRPRPPCPCAAPLPPSARGRSPVPAPALPRRLRTWWLDSEQTDSPPCRHQAREAQRRAFGRLTGSPDPAVSRGASQIEPFIGGRAAFGGGRSFFQVALKVKVGRFFQMVSI